jgi:AraC-like DNA-binding protein
MYQGDPGVLLPSRRVREVMRLSGEVREIAAAGGDPALHTVEGLRRLVGADAGGLVLGEDPRSSNLTRMIHGGLTAGTLREIEELYMTRHAPTQDPAALAIRASGAAAALRRELVTDRAWYGSAFVSDHRRRWHIDDSIYGVFPHPTGVGGIGFFRAWGSRPFDEVDRELASLFIAQSSNVLFAAPGRTPDSCHPNPPLVRTLERVTMDEFVASPVRRYVIGGSFARLSTSPELFASILIGTPDGLEMRELARGYQAEVRRGMPHVSLLHASRVQALSIGAYESLDELWGDRHATRDPLVRRLAVVCPPGMAGATLTGYFRRAPRPFPTRMFDALADALAWLGASGAESAIETIADELSAKGTFSRALRAHLMAAPGATLAQASRALGLSERSLQRRLKIAGSTFRHEVALAQVELAKTLLSESEAKLTSIALEVGCSSSQHFSALFRRIARTTPREWRARWRGG